MIGKFIFARLGSTAAGSRVYPLKLPQNPTLPAVTYHEISAGKVHAMGQDSNVVRVRVQLDSWAGSYSAVRSLATEVKAALSRFKGSAGGVTVQDVFENNEIEFYESDTQLHRVSHDFSFYVQE